MTGGSIKHHRASLLKQQSAERKQITPVLPRMRQSNSEHLSRYEFHTNRRRESNRPVSGVIDSVIESTPCNCGNDIDVLKCFIATSCYFVAILTE